MDREPCHDIRSDIPASDSRSLDLKCQRVMRFQRVRFLHHFNPIHIAIPFLEISLARF